MHSANALANAMSGLRVRRAPSGGANALANAMGGLAVGRSSAASGESQRDRALRKVVLEALLEIKRLGSAKTFKKLGFEPRLVIAGPGKGDVAYYAKTIKRAIFKVEFLVEPNGKNGPPFWSFSVLVKRPNAQKWQTNRLEILAMHGNGINRVSISPDIGDAHDRAIARKAVQSVGWQTIG